MSRMTDKKVALITGVTGQDGAYLAEFLLKKGYEVHGIKRRASSFNTDRIDHLYQDPHVNNRDFVLHYGDLTDSTNLTRIVQKVQPDEIYNLAAQSHVAVSFEEPEYTANADGLGALRLLEAIRILGLEKKTRFYQASTSELYGLVQEIPQKETTRRSIHAVPYAVAKLYAYWITVNYREAYGMYACNGVLFNHESPLRGETFVTRKITRAARAHRARPAGLAVPGQHERAARLGPCARLRADAVVDAAAGHVAEDFVIATGVQYSVRDFVRMSAKSLGITVRFDLRGRGRGRHRRCRHRRQGQVQAGPGDRARRPALLPPHRGRDAPGRPDQGQGKAGLDADRPRLPELVAEMIDADYNVARTRCLVKPGRLPDLRAAMSEPGVAHQASRAGTRRSWSPAHRGMVGSALVRRLAHPRGYDQRAGPARAPNST